jgi:hypothetical protein
MNIECILFLRLLQAKRRADERTRTADLLITSELLYQLSYVGLLRAQSIPQGSRARIRPATNSGPLIFRKYSTASGSPPAKGTLPIWHPRWALDAFWDFEIPQDLVVGYGYPQLTEQAKRKILGENLLRLSGMDVDDTRKKLSGAA